MRTAFIRDGHFLLNLNQIQYGKVSSLDTGNGIIKWKATFYFQEGKTVFWTYDTEAGALGKLDEVYQSAAEISLTEVLG